MPLVPSLCGEYRSLTLIRAKANRDGLIILTNLFSSILYYFSYSSSWHRKTSMPFVSAERSSVSLPYYRIILSKVLLACLTIWCNFSLTSLHHILQTAYHFQINLIKLCICAAEVSTIFIELWITPYFLWHEAHQSNFSTVLYLPNSLVLSSNSWILSSNNISTFSS